jgi:transposase-like protein
MHAQEIAIEVPSQGAHRATEEGSKNGRKKPERFSARQKAEVVLRLLRGEALDILSRELGLPAARLATWREAFLAAGQEAMQTHPLDHHDRELGRLREKLGESTMEIELLREKIGRLETSRPLTHRRSRR